MVCTTCEQEVAPAELAGHDCPEGRTRFRIPPEQRSRNTRNAALARWGRTTPQQRSEHGRRMADARWAKFRASWPTDGGVTDG